MRTSVSRALPAPPAAVLVCALMAVVAQAACTAPPAPPSELRVAATLPLSGADATVGLAMRRGYERAIAAVNDAGGLPFAAGARVPVKLVVRDDRAETPLSERALEEWLADGTHLVLATAGHVRAAAQAVLANRLELPLVGNTVDAAGLPGPRMQWVFTVPASGDVEARAYQTAKAALEGVSRASAFDRTSLRLALAATPTK